MNKYVQSMAYRYRWLDQALDDLGEEIGYVRNKFGKNAARKAESKIRTRVEQLCIFPNIGVLYENLLYNGNEVRILHLGQVSVIYSFHNELITLIAVWNNRRDETKLADVIGSR